jgi:ABC-2 type transport system permease protein
MNDPDVSNAKRSTKPGAGDIDPRVEAALFRRVRASETIAHLRQLMATARLRTLLVIGLSIFFWCGLFALFYVGFDFLRENVARPGEVYHAKTVEFVFHLFFASLNVMLVFSSGIILYGALFSSQETRFLLTTPAREERIVLHKFQEATLFSSWGFFLLASPLTLAYGISVSAPWHYYVLIGPLIVSFVYIPCVIGALCCLLLIYKLAHVRVAVVVIVAALSMLAAGAAIWETIAVDRKELFEDQFFLDTIRKFRFTREQWLPSSWLSNGLIDAAQASPRLPTSLRDTPMVRALLSLALLVTNALMGRLILTAVARRTFRTGFSQLECRPRRPRRAGAAWIDQVAAWFLKPFPPQVRLLLMKDWRLLRRDPVQWSQFLIFFGLLGLYFLNVDQFRVTAGDIEHATWVNLVSFLNLAVVGLILSTFTTRFIYPMLSLEGRRFWVLGLMPVSRETIVWSKFVFAALGSWLPCAMLILLSDLMLHVEALVVGVHQLTTVLLCVGLAALAVGLGAMMPNFHESSPSKIAAGFGGTLNLVLSAVYIILIVSLTALPCHFKLIASSSAISSSFLNEDYLNLWLVLGAGLAVAVGLTATVVPLYRGVRAFNRLEFY